MSRPLLGVGLGVWAGVLALCLSSGAMAVDLATGDYQLQPRQVAAQTWVIEGAVEDFSRANGCNIINTAFVATDEGVLVINTGPSWRYGQQQRAAIARTVPQSLNQGVKQVVNLNLHPDYFFGNQAYADVPVLALGGSRAGMQAEGKAYEDNLYRLCGDWMKGTESTPARQTLTPGPFVLGGHALEWRRLQGHTADDLLLIDHSTGVLFAGGLVFADRVPTLPHAKLPDWIASLRTVASWIDQGTVHTVVPSHGPVHRGRYGVDQTLDWLQWLHQRLHSSASQGLDLSEVLRLPIPERFSRWAALSAEYARSVTYLYPQYETDQFATQTVQAETGR
ncbi:MBL fold metallo-hydrolase [Limnohabitans sp. T6-5]|uniref:quinoprotein relay system zinc metallohydrolase 1 n=1 Tax=Limnohabitans sp. T6-5 TaxID=1100724 RepID=UPI000D39FF74|nr:quinoprotein relay system zinc metallohydrolase 1 [Limnohabitans sp. T6-5]PUE09420.1 MBL fold metallo-hydrolase [Limnohabitans sp. T6-5]